MFQVYITDKVTNLVVMSSMLFSTYNVNQFISSLYYMKYKYYFSVIPTGIYYYHTILVICLTLLHISR